MSRRGGCPAAAAAGAARAVIVPSPPRGRGGGSGQDSAGSIRQRGTPGASPPTSGGRGGGRGRGRGGGAPAGAGSAPPQVVRQLFTGAPAPQPPATARVAPAAPRRGDRPPAGAVAPVAADAAPVAAAGAGATAPAAPEKKLNKFDKLEQQLREKFCKAMKDERVNLHGTRVDHLWVEARKWAFEFGKLVTLDHSFGKVVRKRSAPVADRIRAQFHEFLEATILNVTIAIVRTGYMLEALVHVDEALEELNAAANTKKAEKPEQLVHQADLETLVYWFLGAACGRAPSTPELKPPQAVIDLISSFKERDGRIKSPPTQPTAQPTAAEGHQQQPTTRAAFAEVAKAAAAAAEAAAAVRKEHQKQYGEYSSALFGSCRDGSPFKKAPDFFRGQGALKNAVRTRLITNLQQHTVSNTHDWLITLAILRFADVTTTECLSDMRKMKRLARRALDNVVHNIVQPKARAAPVAVAVAAPAVAVAADDAAPVAAPVAAGAPVSADAAPAAAPAPALDESATITRLETDLRVLLTIPDTSVILRPTEDNLKKESNIFFWLRFARDASKAVTAHNLLAEVDKKLPTLSHVTVVPHAKPHLGFIEFGVQSMAEALVEWIGSEIVPERWSSAERRKQLPRDEVVAAFAKALPPGALAWNPRFLVFSFLTDGRSIRATGHSSHRVPFELRKRFGKRAAEAVEAFVRKLRREDFDVFRLAKEQKPTEVIPSAPTAGRGTAPSLQTIVKQCEAREAHLYEQQKPDWARICEIFKLDAARFKVMCTIDPGITNFVAAVFAYLENGEWKVDPYQQLRIHLAELQERERRCKQKEKNVGDGVKINIARILDFFKAKELVPGIRDGHRRPESMTTKACVGQSGHSQRLQEELAFRNGNHEYRALIEKSSVCTTIAERCEIDEKLLKFDADHPGRRTRKYTGMLLGKAPINEFIDRIVGIFNEKGEKIGNHKKEEVVIGVGDWALNSCTGHFKLTPPIKQLLVELRKRATVVFLQEYHTSAACCACQEGRTTTKNALVDILPEKKSVAAPSTADAAQQQPPRPAQQQPAAHKSRREPAAAATSEDAAPQPAQQPVAPTMSKSKMKRQLAKQAKKEAKRAAAVSRATNEDAAAAQVSREQGAKLTAQLRLSKGTKDELLAVKAQLKEMKLPCETRARHGTAVCTNHVCGAVWQRDINGATNQLQLLLAQIKGGAQTNQYRPKHLKFADLPVRDKWRLADIVAARKEIHAKKYLPDNTNNRRSHSDGGAQQDDPLS